MGAEKVQAVDPLARYSQERLMRQPWLAAEPFDIWEFTAERDRETWTDCLGIVSPLDEEHGVPVFMTISPTLTRSFVLATEITRARRLVLVDATKHDKFCALDLGYRCTCGDTE